MHAGGVVTNCTEANLRSALVGGGTVTFECDGTIKMAAELVITNEAILDASGRSMILSGNNSTRLFAVTNNARLRLINLTLRDGRAQYGGAIYNSNGRVELLNCAVENNVAVTGANGFAKGGAIWNSGSLTSRLFIANCTFSGNRGEGPQVFGGAIASGEPVFSQDGNHRFDHGDTTIVNSTFFGNSAIGDQIGLGSAIGIDAGVTFATNCTFAENLGPMTIVAEGRTNAVMFCRNCVFARTRGGVNIGVAITDRGGNLSDDNSYALPSATSRYGVDARLGGLADNGGPTKTVALLEGSPASNAGLDAGCPPTDQRGAPRPVGGQCDIGAFEGSLPLPFFTQTFTPAVFAKGETTRLQFTLQNTSAVVFSAVAFTNQLPAEIRIANQPDIANACGNGTVIAEPGSGTIVVHGATLGSNQTCSFSLSVSSSTTGIWTNPAVAYWSDRTAMGRSNSPAILTVVGAPIVTTLPVSNVASNSARLHATVDPEGVPTAVYFQYGTTLSLGSATTPVAAGSNYVEVPATADLASLAADTTYFYRVVASNAVGVSYGDILSFATHGAPLTSSWFDEAALLAVLANTNTVAFTRDGNITMTNTLLIDRDTTLDGTGRNVVVSGGKAVRVFHVNPGVRLTLINLTIADGRHTGTNATNYAGTGGRGEGGGVYNQGGTVTLLSCVLSNNAALGGDGLNYGASAGTGLGGAVFNEGGALFITNCLLAQNSAIGGGALYNSPAYPNPPVASGDGFGGGICSQGGSVSIAGSRFRGNTASSGYSAPWFLFNAGPWGSAFGGAIHADGGSVNLDGCLLETNSVVQGGGAGGARNIYSSGNYSGGAISVSNALLHCVESMFATNQAFPREGGGGGGAVYSAGTTWLSKSTFFANLAAGIGATYYAVDSRGGGLFSVSQLAISDCTFAGNLVRGGGNLAYFGLGGRGTGIGSNGYGGAIFNQGDLRMTNTTLFANEARGGDGIVINATNFGLAGLARGGALFNAGGIAQLVNVTLANNGAFLGAGNPPTNNVAPVQGGGIFSTNGTVTLWNSIVANSGSSSNCFGVLVDGGHNLSSDGSCKFSALGSLNNTDPRLSPLDDFGGPTLTIALGAGSPALDAADAAHCPPTDQRGIARPFGMACDIGAFESAPPYSIRGRVSGWNVGGMSVTAGSLLANADSNGYFVFSSVPEAVYFVSPSSSGRTFTPTSRLVDLARVKADAVGVDFYSPVPYPSNSFAMEMSPGLGRATFAGASNQGYLLLVSTNLSEWHIESSFTTDGYGVFQFLLTNSPSSASRFFEAVRP
jgi:hypothetical protein